MFTKEIADKICKRIAEGESLRSICKDEGMPNKSTVLRWLLDDDKKDFCDQYTRARESQAEHYLDEIIEIADDCTDDIEKLISQQEGTDYRVKHSAIARARLQIDTRKWTMSKLAPKKYGDKMQNEHSGNVGIMQIPPMTRAKESKIDDALESEY